jgi:hypothetical protein
MSLQLNLMGVDKRTMGNGPSARGRVAIGLALLFTALLAGCGPHAVYLVSPPTTTTVPTTTTAPPTTTTTVALEVVPTVTCPNNYSWNGSDCGWIGVDSCANGQPPISGSMSNGTATCGGNGELATVPDVQPTITCPGGYSLEDSQATGYYQECVLS